MIDDWDKPHIRYTREDLFVPEKVYEAALEVVAYLAMHPPGYSLCGLVLKHDD